MTLEQEFKEVDHSVYELFLKLCSAFKIDKLCEWLDRVLK